MPACARQDDAYWYRRLESLGIVLNQPERVLICCRDGCGYALQVSGQRVKNHLWEKHQIPKETRSGLTYFIRSLNLPDPRSVPPRKDGVEPHPHLAEILGPYRTISPKLIGHHLSCHGFRRGRKDWVQDDPKDHVVLQCWV
jgi:hypothetical protein